MLARTTALLATLTILGSLLFAAAPVPSVTVGDQIILDLSGDLAKEYVQRIRGSEVAPNSGLQISTSATVEQTFDDGRIRIKHSTPIQRDGKLAKLLTLTATIDSAKITNRITPVGTQVAASPAKFQAGEKTVAISREANTRQLSLSDLKGIKLRTWTLSEEIGD